MEPIPNNVWVAKTRDLDSPEIVLLDTKKSSHTGSEMSIIKASLFRKRLTDHSPLYELI